LAPSADMVEVKKNIIISDGTGKTAKRLMDAVLAQYQMQEVEFSLENIHQAIRTNQQIKEILENIDRDFLVIFSIVSDDLRSYTHRLLHERGILHLNVLEPMLKTMTKFLGFHPDYKPGLLQVIDDKYYSKVDAIGFAVEHDDGRGFQLHNAEIILLGLSRTCKTPISMYLACNPGIRVANIPIIAEPALRFHLLRRLEGIERNKIIGLMMDVDILCAGRAERSQVMADDPHARQSLKKYCDPAEIKAEIKFCKLLFEELQIEVLNVTRRAIEEVSLEVLDNAGLLPSAII